MAATIAITVRRLAPGEGAAPVDESYAVPVTPGMTLTEALVFVRDRLDGSLAFRACAGGCRSSCAVMVDGVPRLACAVEMGKLGTSVRVEPLAHFPVIRDLVADFAGFEAKLRAAVPWLVPGPGAGTPGRPGRDRYAGLASCTLCGLCHAACPVAGSVPGFLGPAALAAAVRRNLDPRDRGADARPRHLAAGEGVWECSGIGECSRACPAGVDPAAAIELAKREAADAAWRSVFAGRGSGGPGGPAVPPSRKEALLWSVARAGRRVFPWLCCGAAAAMAAWAGWTLL